MNCIEKMYKEIEEIKAKEALEFAKLQVPKKTIQNAFLDTKTFIEEPVLINYLENVKIDESYEKKYFSIEKARDFVVFIFKKFLCFNKHSNAEVEFVENLKKEVLEKEDLLDFLTKKQNEFDSLINSDNLVTFYENPYNALFKDDKGYYAVIKDGKYSDVRRPFSYNLNQLKKVVKETVNAYTEDFSSSFASEKERSAFINSFNAKMNKANGNSLEEVQTLGEQALYEFLSKKGVSKDSYEQYLEEKGLRLIKQGNYYFNKKPYLEYGEYKKIEFRY